MDTGLIEPAPKWTLVFAGLDLMKMSAHSTEKEYIKLLDRVNNEEYLYWDKFKHVWRLSTFSIEEYWGYLRFCRNSAMKKVDLLDTSKRQFG